MTPNTIKLSEIRKIRGKSKNAKISRTPPVPPEPSSKLLLAALLIRHGQVQQSNLKDWKFAESIQTLMVKKPGGGIAYPR